MLGYQNYREVQPRNMEQAQRLAQAYNLISSVTCGAIGPVNTDQGVLMLAQLCDEMESLQRSIKILNRKSQTLGLTYSESARLQRIQRDYCNNQVDYAILRLRGRAPRVARFIRDLTNAVDSLNDEHRERLRLMTLAAVHIFETVDSE